MKRKPNKKKSKEVTYGQLLCKEFFSLGDQVAHEAVSVVDVASKEFYGIKIKK